jgi:hypothetical protein
MGVPSSRLPETSPLWGIILPLMILRVLSSSPVECVRLSFTFMGIPATMTPASEILHRRSPCLPADAVRVVLVANGIYFFPSQVRIIQQARRVR